MSKSSEEKQNAHLRNALSFVSNPEELYQLQNTELKSVLGGMANSSEDELRNSFIEHFAAEEEDLSGEVADRTLDSTDPSLEAEDVPEEEVDETEALLAEPDSETVETIEWDNFTIEKYDDYSSKLQNEQGLSQEDADDRATYIMYTDAEGHEFGVQGPMFGRNREEGLGEGFIGGFKSYVEIQKDFQLMKDRWEKFPKDRDYMFVEMSQMSPSLEAYERRKKNELPDVVDQQEEKAEFADENEEVDEESIEEDLNVEEVPESKKSDPQPSVPKPLGKVPASFMDSRLKRESRLALLKNI
jgi:hypothetical protein